MSEAHDKFINRLNDYIDELPLGGRMFQLNQPTHLSRGSQITRGNGEIDYQWRTKHFVGDEIFKLDSVRIGKNGALLCRFLDENGEEGIVYEATLVRCSNIFENFKEAIATMMDEDFDISVKNIREYVDQLEQREIDEAKKVLEQSRKQMKDPKFKHYGSW